VEVEHLQSFRAALFAEVFDGFEEFAGREPELSTIATGECPLTHPACGKANTDTHEKLDLHGSRSLDREAKLFRLFDNENDLFAKLSTQESGADELSVFVPVADEETFRITMVGEPGKELGFASDLESKVKRFARIENFLHHLPHLIHFDRENATVRAFVASGFDGVGKGFIDGADAVAKQIVETDEEGIVQTAFACTGGYFE
jgi:hypothetical protein